MNGVTHTLIIARKEVRDALRNRWFAVFSVAFTLLSLGVSSLSSMGADLYGAAGFGRTAAGLLNLVLLVVPLMALAIGTPSLAAERERGTLAYLMAQPVSRGEVLVGKFLGLAAALLGALTLGFGVAAARVAISGEGGSASAYLALVAMTFALALAMLSVGLLISCVCGRGAVAQGIGVFTWLGLVFLSDLGLMGSALALRLGAAEVLRLALVNPLQAFKLAVLGTLDHSLDVLGPAGAFATQSWGRALPLVLAAVLGAWIVGPLVLNYMILRKRGTP